MAIDLGKVVFKKLEDGSYTLIPTSWDIKATIKNEDYVALSCRIKDTDRIIQINLFEKGLNITTSNVSEFLGLPETSIADVLDTMLNQELPAYHETVQLNGKTYFNWYICSTPNLSTEDGPAF